MSLDAMRWAMKQKIRPSTVKFVLVAMADRAGENHTCFPSIRRLQEDTSQDRKTVMNALKLLAENGVIRDTGERKGRTKSVVVWELCGIVGRENEGNETIHELNLRKTSSTKNGTPKQYRFSHPSSTKNGTPKQYQKRDIEPISNNQSSEPVKINKKTAKKTNLQVYLAQCKTDGVDAIPEDHRVFTYAREVGIPQDYLHLAWMLFCDKYNDLPNKRYADWKLVFLNAVKNNWLRVWWITTDGDYQLTTVGRQAEKMSRRRNVECVA